jgi:hypothetical protein
MKPGEIIETKTPNAVTAIRGTVVVAEVVPTPEGHRSTISVLRGVIDVTRLDRVIASDCRWTSARLATHRAKPLAEVGTRWDYVITVCDAAYERCPEFEQKTSRLHWGVEDPSQVPGTPAHQLEVFRRVRDDLAERVRRWLADLTER